MSKSRSRRPWPMIVRRTEKELLRSLDSIARELAKETKRAKSRPKVNLWRPGKGTPAKGIDQYIDQRVVLRGAIWSLAWLLANPVGTVPDYIQCDRGVCSHHFVLAPGEYCARCEWDMQHDGYLT